MRIMPVSIQHAIIIVSFLLALTAGTHNLAGRLEFGLETAGRGGMVVITAVAAGSEAEAAGIREGDRLRSLRGTEIVNAAQARWLLKGTFDNLPAELTVNRQGKDYKFLIQPQFPFHPALVVLNCILGLVFFSVGLMVWWPASRDPAAGSFLRITACAGISFLLFSHENALKPLFLHHAYTYTWLLTYCLTPAALLDFLFRFPRASHLIRHKTALLFILYLPFLCIFATLCLTYAKAFASFNPDDIYRYELIFRFGLGTALLLYIVGGLLRLTYLYMRPKNVAERDRTRWLLICTFLGLAPFIFLYKLPIVLGGLPLAPIWAALGMMVVVPIGWGMTVASFRMLKVEWVLSRTMVYAIAFALILYLLLAMVLFSTEYLSHPDNFTLIVLTAVGLLVLLLAVAGLINRLRWLIDRVYYSDWFSYRQAVQELGYELSNALSEEALVHIITQRLAQIVKIEKAILLIRNPEGRWSYPPQTSPLPPDLNLDSALHGESGWPETHKLNPKTGFTQHQDIANLAGFRIALPLMQSENILGLLLLGRKNSGAPYSSRDYDLFQALSNYAAAALANVALSKKILDQEKRTLAVEMAGGIAHEINNALGPLLGQAQLMELAAGNAAQPIPPEQIAQPLGIMVEMCHRIKRIALNLNKLSEPLRLEKNPVCLNTIAEDTLQLLSETAGRIKRYSALDEPEIKFRLRKEFDPKIPQISGDAQQLSQVFINLIINAADAMETQGHGTLTIGTRCDADRQHIVGYVQDTGPGISHALQDKVFQPYFTTKPRGKGTGLGLAIVRSIVEAHGGQVHLSSQLGKGTRLEFTLPINTSNS